MNLTRNNYEECFLLYVDGELNPAQKEMVEVFVLANPDLQQELQMLKETVLSLDEEWVLPNKTSLYKSVEEDAISTNNYQEKFLLYVDDELEQPSKAAVETFVLQHPALQEEFTLLKQTKLPIEIIVCPNKTALYKKEEKPVVLMWMKRLAIAAAVLLFVIMAWLIAPKIKSAFNNGFAATQPKQNKIVPSVATSVNRLQIEAVKNKKVIHQLPINAAPLAVANNVNTKSRNKKTTTPNSTALQQSLKDIAIPKNIIAINKQPSLKSEPIIIATQNEKPLIATKNSRFDNASNNIVSAINKDMEAIAAKPVAYRELNTDDANDESNSVYIGAMQIKKDKINSLFKKAKNFFGKKSISNDAGLVSNQASLK